MLIYSSKFIIHGKYLMRHLLFQKSCKVVLKLEKYIKRAKSLQVQLLKENGAKIAAYEIDKISRIEEKLLK